MVMGRVFEGVEHLDPDDILDRVLCLHPQLVVGPGRGVGVQDEAGGTDLLDMTAATTLSLPLACPLPPACPSPGHGCVVDFTTILLCWGAAPPL